MVSGLYRSVPIDSIIINRPERQRKELTGIEELAASIQDVGLINAIVVSDSMELIAGERRLTAMKSLGWTEVQVQFASDLDPVALYLIELEENVRREDLTWKDHNDAVVAYHRLRRDRDNFTVADTAQAIRMTPSNVSKHLLVKDIREADPDLVNTADTFAGAHNIAVRRSERKQQSKVDKLLGGAVLFGAKDEPAVEGKEKPAPAPTPSAEPERRATIEHLDFIEWAEGDHDTQFNLIHCDFPYGVNVGDKKGQSGAKNRGQYADTEEVYFSLINAFVENQDKFVAPSAHLIFWFSMKFFSETKASLEAAGWRVDPFPLIWHKSDNAGIIPDSQRGGRRTYETALYATRGDRKVVGPVAISFSGPTTKQFHTSEKSAAMLNHFFRMLVDDTTVLLDPTCGSGMAVRVAEQMGARYALGLERDEDFARLARLNCNL